MVWKYTQDTKMIFEGLLLVAFVLFLLSLGHAYSVEQFSESKQGVSYSIVQDSDTLTLQQGTNGKQTFYYNFPQGNYDFYFSIDAPQGITANVIPKMSGNGNFVLPVYVLTSNLESGNYPVTLNTQIIYKGLFINDSKTFNVNVVPKSNLVFGTSKYTNEMPNLELVNVSTQNLFISKDSKNQVVFSLRNTGSATTFFIKGVVDSQDANKIQLNYNSEYFRLEKGEEKNILIDVLIDENYAILYTPVYFYAQDSLSGKQYILPQTNMTLKTQNLFVEFDKEKNILKMQNMGTDFATVDVNTNVKSYSFISSPNQTSVIAFDNNDISATIFLNGKEFETISLSVEKENQNKDENKSSNKILASTTALFSLGSGGVTVILVIIIILVVIFGIYKLIFARNAVFGKTVYVKDLKQEA